jgi:ubiquinone/menaquinone biosynthesis C-methylase UbiE
LAKAPEQVENFISLLGIAPGCKVLDLCCGVGRHSLELSRRGFTVTGVDRTVSYLQKARRKAKKEKLKIEFVKDDMRTFCRPNAFDVVINLFTSFGYFQNQDDNRKVLINVHRSLKDGGVALFDLMGKEILARIFTERGWNEENGIFILEERKPTKNWSWMENRWIIINDNEKCEFKITHRLYSAFEFSELLKDCGFSSVDVYGDLTGAPYDQKARRLVAVAHK